MSLLIALGVASHTDIDPLIPLAVGPMMLGAEAANEAVSILRDGHTPKPTQLHLRSFQSPFYMNVMKDGAQIAEVFGFPSTPACVLPTAVEIAIVRAIASSQAEDVEKILSGGSLVVLGEKESIGSFYDVITCIESPLCGVSILNTGGYSAVVKEQSGRHINSIVIECLRTSFLCAPVKFRYVELYRVMETRFLRDIIDRVNTTFSASPADALKVALESLQSELKQLLAIAEQSQSYFESIRATVFQLRSSGNAFANAIVNKLQKQGGSINASQWKSGACIVYYMRCAIVHAGEKDIVFEAYCDGNDVLDALIPNMELAALACCGVDIT